jgi:hypothetical protein
MITKEQTLEIWLNEENMTRKLFSCFVIKKKKKKNIFLFAYCFECENLTDTKKNE